MNLLKNITIFMVFLIFASSCEKEIDNLKELDNVSAPSNISVTFNIAQDNTGTVTIIPNAEGATKFIIDFGDNTNEEPTTFGISETITHVFSEGVFNIGITAVGLTGLTSSIEQEITVSLDPPENLEVTVENDLIVSKQVNISAIADYAMMMEFYFGEIEGESPIESLPGETVSYIYSEAGDYDITVIAKSGAIETLDSTFTFTVTEISGPQVAAPIPPDRVETDVISIFSDAYADLPNTNFDPDWGQSTIVSFIEIEGDNTMKYDNLNYQGTQFENPIDASEMEYLHLDMWTDDALEINIFLISTGPAEMPASLAINSGVWVSYDIPLSDFSSVVDLSDIIQIKFEGTTGSTLYIDNLYIYRGEGASGPSLPLDFESTSINYAWFDFDGGGMTVIDNPEQSGINTSSRVSQMIKSAGQVWGGSYLDLAAPIDFSVNKIFKMKVFSPRVDANVLLKVEDINNSSISFETEVATSVANTWEELSFDYSAISTSESYQRIVIIFDNGTMGDGSPDFTFLIDDIILTN